MGGFLVLAREKYFDVVMALFEDEEAAREFAEETTEDEVKDAIFMSRDGGLAEEFELYPLNIGIIPFRDGKPGLYEKVKDFADVTDLA